MGNITAKTVNARGRPSRGTDDTQAVMDQVFELWDDVQEALQGYSEDEVEAIKKHFNELIEDHDELGDRIFMADVADFKADYESFETQGDKDTFAAELVKYKVLPPSE